jgi:hypothetical protein
MSALSTVILPDVLRSINSATFTGAYLPIGTPLAFSVRIIKFTNLSTSTCTISWDGINPHEIIPSGGFVLLDVSSNRENAQFFEIQMGTQFYVSGAVGTGDVYISCYYGR